MTTSAERVFLDTSVLLAATDPSRAEHAGALAVINTWPSQGVALLLSGQVIREYLAVATRHAKMNGLGLSPQEAIENARSFLARARLLPEDAGTSEHLLRLVASVPVSGEQIHDANIVATMLGAGVRALLTLNRDDFVRFADRVELVDLPGR